MTATAQPATATATRGRDSRWAALLVLCTGMLMIVLDATVVNVALPKVQADLGFSATGLAWVLNGYLVAFGGLLLAAGKLGDLIGRRKVFVIGVTVFVLASAVCGLSTSPAMLVTARFVQGAGGALTSSVILGMIMTMFDDPRERGRAIGVFAFVASAGGAIGLLVGGALTQLSSWHLIFWVNVPIGVATLIAARRFVPRDEAPTDGAGRERLDVLGAVLITAALMLGVYTIVGPGSVHGWGDPMTLVCAVVTVLLAAGFLVRQSRAAAPLLPLRVLRNRTVLTANAVQAMVVAGMFSVFVLGVLDVQRVRGYDELTTGLAFLPLTIVMAAISVKVAEPVTYRFGGRRVLLASLLLVIAGLICWSRTGEGGSYLFNVLPGSVLLGLGAGLQGPATMGFAMAGVEPRDAGVASGLVNTSMQIGGAFGLAVLVSVSAHRTSALAAAHGMGPHALVAGYRLGFVIAAAVVGLALLLAAVLLRTPNPAADAESMADAEAVNGGQASAVVEQNEPELVAAQVQGPAEREARESVGDCECCPVG